MNMGFPGVRRLALGAFGLLCVIGALQARMAALPASPPPDARQQRVAAVEQAASLLLEDPAPENHRTQTTRQEAGTSIPTQSLAPEPYKAVPGAAPQTGSVPGDATAPRHASVTRFKAVRPLIPEKIESTTSQGSDDDPLATTTISGGLRILDGNDAPLRLLAIRVDGGVASVQLHARGAAPSSGAGDGWLREGDSVLAGWHVVSISRADALVLSPHGNLFRLRTVPGKDSAANRRPPTPSGPQQTPMVRQ